MTRPYLSFVDWLKAVGLGLIVLDHVAHFMLPWRTPPFHPKQLGVVLFVFVIGYTLAREQRPGLRVVIARWLPIWVWGLLFALLMTGVGLLWLRDGNPSDYLPLAFGLNVARDGFPANPTTWYIGTYLHILVLWAVLLRGRRITAPLFGVVLVFEIAVRAVTSSGAGLYVAYQSVFNWLTPLVLGLWLGTDERKPNGRAFALALLVAMFWTLGVHTLEWSPDFPFMAPLAWPEISGWLVTATAVSTGYAIHALLAFHGLGRLPSGRPVRFFARNTPLVFIGHMPVFYAMEATLGGMMPQQVLALLEFAVGFVGLALVSEVIRPRVERLLELFPRPKV